MAKIWWVKLLHANIDRVWMHTIARLNKYPDSQYVGINQFNTQLDELVVGDLVAFCGYSYTPDFLIYDEERDGSLGVVVHIRAEMEITGPM